jgi:UDP-GlcNAc3NAcA epimerase
MSEVFFKGMRLPKPDYNLGVTDFGKMVTKLKKFLKKLKPKLVIVYGDCTTTLAGALAAAYLKIPVAHIEAGLRCGRLDMPEEINRVLTDRISTYKFCPTETAVYNLYREGIRDNVFMVGDVLFDSMNPFCPLKRTKDYNKYVLLTIHREENTTKERLSKIMSAVSKVGKVIFPIHPRTKKALEEFNIPIPSNVKVKNPVGYKEMLTLESNAKHIITDSGGVTREAFWMQIPCTSLRKETEWPETVEWGWNTLADVDEQKILKSLDFIRDKNQPDLIYGAKKRIREILSGYV